MYHKNIIVTNLEHRKIYLIMHTMLYYSGMFLSIIEYSVNTFSLLKKKCVPIIETDRKSFKNALPSYMFLWVLESGK